MKSVLGLLNYSISYSSYTQPASNDLLVSGSTGSKVKWVQAALNFCIKKKYFSGSSLDVDGIYGSETVSAVKAFQKKYALDVDGKFGTKSIKKMKNVLGIKDTAAASTQVWVTTGTGIRDIPTQGKISEMKSGCLFMACCVVGGLGTKEQILTAKKWSVANGYSRDSDNYVQISSQVLAKKISEKYGTPYHSDFIIKKDKDAKGNTHFWVADAKGKEIFNSGGLGFHR